MPLLPVAPPQIVPTFSGFDYVTVDARRRRVYAAHTGARALLIADADSGRVIAQVRVGPLHGVAVDPATGHVFTGDGQSHTVSEVDPEARRVLRTASVGGDVDAVAYDPGNGHIYADEDDGTRIFVLDAATFKTIGTVALPGHKPEYLAVDPATHDVYQNIDDLNEFVIVDGSTFKVRKTVPTPELTANHPLQYDSVFHHVIVGGTNGVLSVYDTNGSRLGTTQMQAHVDQCDLDSATHTLACAGNGEVTVLRDSASGVPAMVTRAPVAHGVHTLAIDHKTGHVFVVWGSQEESALGDFIQRLSVQP
jgi:DNA-binding beta-propeller fold protein YncE